MTLWQLVRMGGITMIVLIGFSVVSLAIIMERIIYYRRRSRMKRLEFMDKVRAEFKAGNVPGALKLCAAANTPFASVVASGLNLHGHNEVVISNAMEREVTVEMMRLERLTSIVGTIASTAVYVGLLGTVLGIIRAFRDMTAAGEGGMNIVIHGIAEALITTAAGLIVAVPAVIAYNYFMKRVDNFIADMELCASELMDMIKVRAK